jgi:hypothetical protein
MDFQYRLKRSFSSQKKKNNRSAHQKNVSESTQTGGVYVLDYLRPLSTEFNSELCRRPPTTILIRFTSEFNSSSPGEFFLVVVELKK